MVIAPHLMRPLYVNLFEALTSAQLDEDARIYAKGTDGKYLYVNHAFARDSGLPPEVLIGSTVCDTAFATDAEQIEADDQRVMRSGTDSFRKVMLQTRRKRMLMYVRKCAIYNERMECIGIAGIYRPHAQALRLRDCLGCGGCEQTVRGLNVALSLLSPELMRKYEELMASKDDEAGELGLFESKGS